MIWTYKDLRKMKLFGPFAQIVTLHNCAIKGPLKNSDLAIIPEGGILTNNGYIVEVAGYRQLKSGNSEAIVVDVSKDSVAIPGLIDCHTHICFAGSRTNDYSSRSEGKTYEQIAAQGGGILTTVKATRDASHDSLVNDCLKRCDQLLSNGITTVEIKSGYGLTTLEELKQLRVIKEVGLKHQCSIVPTCLAAHTIPGEFADDAMGYLKMLVQDLLPIIKTEELAERVDIFIETGAFSTSQAGYYLGEAKKLGFQLTVHADQFSTGGSKLAVEYGALSADHLEASGDKEIRYLSESSTVAVALPGASIGLGVSFAPARKLIDAGCCVAIASDYNPGSAPMGDLLVQASIMGIYEKLTMAELLAGLTVRAAAALGIKDRGSLETSKRADFAIFPCRDFRDVFYYQGSLKPVRVVKEGVQVFSS